MIYGYEKRKDGGNPREKTDALHGAPHDRLNGIAGGVQHRGQRVCLQHGPRRRKCPQRPHTSLPPADPNGSRRHRDRRRGQCADCKELGTTGSGTDGPDGRQRDLPRNHDLHRLFTLRDLRNGSLHQFADSKRGHLPDGDGLSAHLLCIFLRHVPLWDL